MKLMTSLLSIFLLAWNPFSFFTNTDEELEYPTHENAYVPARESAVEEGDTTISALETSSITEVNLVEDFDAVPNDNEDDSAAFEAAFALAAEEPIKLIIPTGEYLIAADYVVTGENIQGLYIQGENAVIKPLHPEVEPMNEHFVFDLRMAEENKGVKIEGITIDGSLNDQDLYFVMEVPEDVYTTPLQRGIFIEGAKDIVVVDTTFQHMYGGYTLSIHDYQDVTIQDVLIDDVGGDDITDSFGMAFYFGGHTGDSVINIDRVVANGKVSPRNPSYTAWIGVVLENGTIQDQNQDNWLVDKNTTVNVTNSDFYDYETTFHVESMAGNVYWNADNINTRAKDYFIAAGVNGELKERTYNLNMEMTPWGRNGIVHGTYYTEKERVDNITGINRFDMYDSTITYLEIDGRAAPIGTSYGDSVVAGYHNVTLENLPGKLVTNGTGIFNDSLIILSSNSTETAASLKRGPFSERQNQTVELNNTPVVMQGDVIAPITQSETAPDWYVPSGYVAPELADPIPPAELHQQLEDNE